jgi:hypothetical protein
MTSTKSSSRKPGKEFRFGHLPHGFLLFLDSTAKPPLAEFEKPFWFPGS